MYDEKITRATIALTLRRREEEQRETKAALPPLTAADITQRLVWRPQRRHIDRVSALMK